MCQIFFLQPLVICIYYVQAKIHIRTNLQLAHMHRNRKGERTWESESKFKVRKEEHSSSVVQTQCFISYCRCVDYLFNWIFLWARQSQRTNLVAVERKMIEQGKGRGRAEEGRWVSIIFWCVLLKTQKPNYHWDRAKTCVHHMYAHVDTQVYSHTHASTQTQDQKYTIGY